MSAIGAAAARRIAVAAQGLDGRSFGGVRTDASPKAVTRRTLASVVDRISVVQIDSVSAFVRAHYMPLFSRVGHYDRSLLDSAAWSHDSRRPRMLVEYWAHEAAFVRIEDWPLFAWRREEYRFGRWRGRREDAAQRAALMRDVLDVVTETGAASAAEIEAALGIAARENVGPWWDPSETKVACEALFASGALAVDRRVGFVRHYDLAERVVPAEVLARRVDEPDAIRALVERSARALGIATEPDLRDYFRLPAAVSRRAVAELVDAGVLAPVEVEGWDRPAYLHHDAKRPRIASGTALLSPFDPLVFFRPRAERIFGFRYRLEIYTPEAARVHGYYVCPFLMDGELVARVDLSSDRRSGVLHVKSAFAEPGRDPVAVAHALAERLGATARWLGLDAVRVAERGDLAADLAKAVAA
ncbi:winged helix-turn-helix domain-containing protein [Rhodococcus rhodnii]|uniref:Winged helix-turn-helix domain-containing protein n=2 Tax=Rhodococcus rhodnii TaxID=38312 RepID=R7WP32_9NOCA|nr:crosslink repair DNA glycosylase YcaQ family protein [Rhodococcus rhodnii]EOM77076.1 hypothetical protein Rrhod_1543 [Rhodococcus rhodnii LMG 5362]TXG90885.1 winged helix-turn-helix domain-containing protein [Rhodococcus rhodnii]